MFCVTIQLYGLMVEVECSEVYPDIADDLVNRAVKAFSTALELTQKAEIALYNPDYEIED